MLGVSAGNLFYRNIGDFHSPADYLEYMYGGTQGIMYRATIEKNGTDKRDSFSQEFFRTSGLIKQAYDGVRECYVSMNTFFREKGMKWDTGRDVKHIKRLTSFYVDIDCYKLGLSKDEVLFRLQDEFFGVKMPVPTFVIDSGRGIYCIWKLRGKDNNGEDSRALSRWQRIEQYLTDCLEELGADQACTDAARILRVPFTLNSKSNTKVKIVEFNDLTYTLRDFTSEYDVYGSGKKKSGKTVYPYNHATERQRKYARDIAMRLGLSEADLPDFTSFKETDEWIKVHRAMHYSPVSQKNAVFMPSADKEAICHVLKQACGDIRTLMSMRKGEDTRRELALFMYRLFLREMGHTSESALADTLSLNASLDCPFTDAYVRERTASVDKRIDAGMTYAYRKDTIIKLLEISDEELKQLPYFSRAVKAQNGKASRKESNKRAYESRLAASGKVAKAVAIEERRTAIRVLLDEGKTPAQIQEALHISRATYHRDIAAMTVKAAIEAVSEVVTEQVEEVKEIVKDAAESVSDAVQGMAETAQSVVTSAVQKTVATIKRGLSHFFSSSFNRHTKCVRTGSPTVLHTLFRRVFRRGSMRDSGDSDDASDSDADG